VRSRRAKTVERARDRNAGKGSEEAWRGGRGSHDPRGEEARAPRRVPRASMRPLSRALLVGDHDERAGALVREHASARLRRIDARVIFDVASELSRDGGADRGVLEEHEARHR